MSDLPETLPGHWMTPSGHQMAQRFVDKPRSSLMMADHSDLELANALYLESGPIALQTAAKDRMRWLSVQLALALAEIEAMKVQAAEDRQQAAWEAMEAAERAAGPD